MVASNPVKREKFGIKDIGCYADGALGHDHCRHVLSAIVENVYEGTPKLLDIAEALDALQGEMSDDAWEEDEVLEALNEHCGDEVYFVFEAGDLLLVESEEL